MNKWEKISTVLLHLVSEVRVLGGAVRHVSSEFGRACDTLERMERRQEEIHASHQKANREITSLDTRVSRLERGGNAAE
jgi:prefoldin subunit 5